MRLSIVIPAYNEIATIAEILRKVLEAPVKMPKELIVVDDCSTDGTREYLDDLVKRGVFDSERGTLKVLFQANCLS